MKQAIKSAVSFLLRNDHIHVLMIRIINPVHISYTNTAQHVWTLDFYTCFHIIGSRIQLTYMALFGKCWAYWNLIIMVLFGGMLWTKKNKFSQEYPVLQWLHINYKLLPTKMSYYTMPYGGICIPWDFGVVYYYTPFSGDF